MGEWVSCLRSMVCDKVDSIALDKTSSQEQKLEDINKIYVACKDYRPALVIGR